MPFANSNSQRSKPTITKTSHSVSEEELRESISYTLDDLVNIEQSARFHNTDWAEYTIEKLVTQYSLTKQLEARVDEREVDEEDRCEIEVGA